MSPAVTSSITWCALRPLTAANMLLIIWASLPSDRGPLKRRGPAGRSSLPCGSGTTGLRLGDYRRVDVREDVLLHVVAVDRRDDGAVAHGHDERRVVHEDHGLARALAVRAVDARL